MSRGKRTIVPHRRRRQLKTNYRHRLTLLKSRKPRLVVRKSLNRLVCQIVDYQTTGDRCLVAADSSELAKFGWRANRGNIPAAYLTGLLCGIRAKKKKIGDAILDTGLYTSTPGNRLYAALKGAVDAGLHIPHSPDILPDDERAKGTHISSYAAMLKGGNPADYKRMFSSYLKGKLTPESLPEHFDQIKEKILKSG